MIFTASIVLQKFMRKWYARRFMQKIYYESLPNGIKTMTYIKSENNIELSTKRKRNQPAQVPKLSPV